jgi:hypothetical protein
MGKPESEKLFKEGQVIVVNGRAALITNIGGDGTTNSSIINYNFINGDGTLAHGGHFQPWEKGIKHIDFAKVRTLVELPPEWEQRAIEYDKKQPTKTMLDDWDPEEHPSYGTIQVGRCSGHTALFMSPFKHHNYMTLSIHRATKHRSLANDRTFHGRELIEVMLSEAQWARMLSSAGVGEGTPCTLNHVAGSMVPPCPEQVEVEKFHADTKRYMEKSSECLDDAIKAMQGLMDKPSVTKAERKEVLSKLTFAKQHLTSGLPFVATQIRERMEHIVCEGKTEIEAFFQRQVQRLGLKQLQTAAPVEFIPQALPPAKTTCDYCGLDGVDPEKHKQECKSSEGDLLASASMVGKD